MLIGFITAVIAAIQLGWDIYSDTREHKEDPSVTVRMGFTPVQRSNAVNTSELKAQEISLLRNNDDQRYGIKVGRFKRTSNENITVSTDFNAYGLTLEQKLGYGLLASLGVMGYSSYDGTGSIPVGTTIDLGWEPTIWGQTRFQTYIALRNDTIYGIETESINSIFIGITWNSAN